MVAGVGQHGCNAPFGELELIVAQDGDDNLAHRFQVGWVVSDGMKSFQPGSRCPFRATMADVT